MQEYVTREYKNQRQRPNIQNDTIANEKQEDAGSSQIKKAQEELD